MEHRSRRMIYNYISAHPGVSFGSIKRIMELNSSTLRYHLEYLERAGSVMMEKEGGKRCYRPNNGSSASFVSDVDTQSLPKAQGELLEIINRNPGITKKQLVKRTRMEKKKVSYNLRRLKERRFIWYVRNTSGYEAVTREKIKKEMLLILMDRYLKGEIDKDAFQRFKQELERR